MDDAYLLIRSAVLEHRCLTATYRRHIRHFSPHCLGLNKDGGFSVLGFQYAGESSTVLPRGGEWRCFALQDLAGLRTNRDSWHTGPHAGPRSGCVKQVDVDAYLGRDHLDRRPTRGEAIDKSDGSRKRAGKKKA